MTWDSHYLNKPTDLDDLYPDPYGHMDDAADAYTALVVSVIAWGVTLFAAVTGCILLVQAFPLEAAWLIAQF